ncbi:MAG: hypothetical protein CMH26_05470 [Micavibrio sp.]|nr:hypothetical protein [Micavibrio sp.]|tara:strand:- start:126 stop:401 length:276 start_codon:yes stop_codon:yes gene_type:complete
MSNISSNKKLYAVIALSAAFLAAVMSSIDKREQEPAAPKLKVEPKVCEIAAKTPADIKAKNPSLYSEIDEACAAQNLAPDVHAFWNSYPGS